MKSSKTGLKSTVWLSMSNKKNEFSYVIFIKNHTKGVENIFNFHQKSAKLSL